MTVPAHSSAYGHTYHQNYYINEHMVYDGPGYVPYGPYQSGFVYTDGYNGKFGVVGDRKNPTPYDRTIVSVMAQKPHIWRQQDRYSNGQNYLDQYWKRWPVGDFDPMYLVWPHQFDLEVADALAKAKTKALNKLSEHKVQYGVSVLEMRRTATMVATNTIRIYKAYKAWKQGNGIEWLQDLYRDRELAKRFLEFQYGWKPLMADIKSGAELLNRGILEDNLSIESKSAPRVHLQTEWVASGGYETRWTCRGRAKVRLIANIRSSYLEYFNTLGLLNPLEIAWELVPYSFVADWFIPIGSTLSALSASAGLDLSSRSQLHFSKTGIFEARSISQPWNGYNGTTQVGYLKVGKEIFSRSPLYGVWPMPELYNKGNPFSTTHILNAIGLIGARL
jgi:hypothetical protein